MYEAAESSPQRASAGTCTNEPAGLSQPLVSDAAVVKEATANGVSETDAIHHRLSGLPSSDSVSNLASAVMDQMENGETSKMKKTKKNDTKPRKPGKKPTERKKPGSKKVADKLDSGKASTKNKKASAAKVREGADKPDIPIAEPRLPYLRVKGPLNSPSFVKIVNRLQTDEEQQKLLTHRLKSSAQITDEQTGLRARGTSFFVSAMSENYDAHHRDPSWTCVFCHRHSHADLLGDLYGPYFLDVNPDLAAASSNDVATAAPVARRRNSSAKGHRRHSESGANGIGTPASNVSHTKRRDVWFHEDCLVWAPGVCFVAPKLLGLDLALQETHEMICDHCSKKGAHIFCRFPGCQQRTHFPCAQDHGWSLQEATFTALCPLHEQVPL